MTIAAFGRRRGSGWPLTMHVVQLDPDEVLVHSPTWIDDATLARIAALGTPRILFAPNHFHHLDLRRYREHFAEASVVASAGAIPRLRARGHEGLVPTGEVALPPGMRWLVPEGTKSGEAWLSIDGDGGPTWIVCDAFFNETKPLRGLEGAMLRLGRIAPGLCVGATFTMLCLADKERYRDWVLGALARERPRRVLFSHGDPIEEDAAPRLAARVRERLGG